MKYQIVENQTRTGLEELVNSYLRDGWEPVGGVCFQLGAGWRLYLQALIKR